MGIAETRRERCAVARDDVALALENAGIVFVTVLKLGISHGIAQLQFHEGQCVFSGIAVQCMGVSKFEGELVRVGPSRFQISAEGESSGAERDEWHISSDDGKFLIVAKWFGVIDPNQRPTLEANTS